MYTTHTVWRELEQGKTSFDTRKRSQQSFGEIESQSPARGLKRTRTSSREAIRASLSSEVSDKSNARGSGTVHEVVQPFRVGMQVIGTKEAEQMAYYMSEFHRHTHNMCAWTDLLELPRRSVIPPIARRNKRSARGLTNWANYYLPHLATGSMDDPLSLAMVVMTAYKMNQRTTAIIFYAKVLQILRNFIKRQNSRAMAPKDYIKAWATTLLLAEYEAQQGNQRVRAYHIEGATTMCLLVGEQMYSATSTESGSNDSSTDSLSSDSPATMNENPAESIGMSDQIPAYLQELTQRYRHSSTICLPLGREWPTVTPRMETSSMATLLAQSAHCYAYCMQVIELFFNRLINHPPDTAEELAALKDSFKPQVTHARAHLAIYDQMLDNASGIANIQQSCSRPGVPFSPIIQFGNPYMIPAHLVPHVFRVLLSAFMPEECASSLTYIAGVYAGLESSPEIFVDSAYPDIYIFAFWKAGKERDYWSNHISRRHEEFQRLIHRIWSIIDSTEDRLGFPLTSTDIIRLTLREYKVAQSNAISTAQTRYYQIEGLMSRSWSVAIGSDPSTTFMDGPHTHKYRKRTQQLRESFHGSGPEAEDSANSIYAFRESGPLRSQEVEYVV